MIALERTELLVLGEAWRHLCGRSIIVSLTSTEVQKLGTEESIVLARQRRPIVQHMLPFLPVDRILFMGVHTLFALQRGVAACKAEVYDGKAVGCEGEVITVRGPHRPLLLRTLHTSASDFEVRSSVAVASRESCNHNPTSHVSRLDTVPAAQ